MKSKKILALAISAVMGAALLSGCTPSGGDKNKKETTAQSGGGQGSSATTIKVLIHRTDRLSDGGDGSLEEMTKAFEEENNCRVQYQGFTDYESDISTMLSTSTYGDVLMIPNTVKLVDLANFFEPLGTYEEMDAKYRWANYKMYDNTVYGLSHGCRTDFADIQNKKECGGNRQWQNHYLRNWAANTKGKGII